jgi:hypothetical protein
MLEELFTHLTVWHWLALGLMLFGIEMMTGTFDLLMISIAAWLTAAFAWLAPDSLATWQGQVLFFGAASVALVRCWAHGPVGHAQDHARASDAQQANGQPCRSARRRHIGLHECRAGTRKDRRHCLGRGDRRWLRDHPQWRCHRGRRRPYEHSAGQEERMTPVGFTGQTL